MPSKFLEESKKYKIKHMTLSDLTSIKAIMIYNCIFILLIMIGVLYLVISNTTISAFIVEKQIQKKGAVLITLLLLLIGFLWSTLFFGLFLKSRRRFMRHYALVSTTPTLSTDKKTISKADIKKRLEEYKINTIHNRKIFLPIYFSTTLVVVITVLTLILVKF